MAGTIKKWIYESIFSIPGSAAPGKRRLSPVHKRCNTKNPFSSRLAFFIVSRFCCYAACGAEWEVVNFELAQICAGSMSASMIMAHTPLHTPFSSQFYVLVRTKVIDRLVGPLAAIQPAVAVLIKQSKSC